MLHETQETSITKMSNKQSTTHQVLILNILSKFPEKNIRELSSLLVNATTIPPNHPLYSWKNLIGKFAVTQI